jgi:hypothetical protein
LFGKGKRYCNHQKDTSREQKVQSQANYFKKEKTKMIDPRSQYIIYKERETNLMLKIEQKLAAQERGEHAQASQPWYSAAEQWLKEKVFSRGAANNQCCPDGSAA